MPVLKQIDCSIELGPSFIKLPEYGTLIRDGYIETFVAVPAGGIPFTIHVKSHGYIHSGLAVFVFIDGEHQCNRNRSELKTPGRGVHPKDYEVEFRLRQKEEKLAEGKFVAREWTFEKLDRVKADKAAKTGKSQYAENVGTIEVVVLRCQSDEQDVPPRLMPTRVREAEATPTKTTKKELKQQPKKQPSVREAESDIGIGGLFGIFDGAYDNMRVHGPGDHQPGESSNDRPPQTTEELEWDPVVGEYRPISQHISHDEYQPTSRALQPSDPQYNEPQQVSGFTMPGDPQTQTAANQPGDQSEILQHIEARKVKFELGAPEETTPPRISAGKDLLERFRAVFNGSSPFTQDEDGVVQFRQELDMYKTVLRRFENHNPEDYAIKIRTFPDPGQLEMILASMRRELGLDSEPAPASGPLKKVDSQDSQVLTDGAMDGVMDGYNYGQPDWQEMGQGAANGAQAQPQTYGQGPAQYNQGPAQYNQGPAQYNQHQMQLVRDQNGNTLAVPVIRANVYNGFTMMPQGGQIGNQRGAGRDKQPNVHFVNGGQFQGQDVGHPNGYRARMAREAFQQQQQPWFDRNGAPWNGPSEGPMQQGCVPDDYVDSKFKDDGEWDRNCKEWAEERERKGLAGASGINNKKFQEKAAQDERKKSHNAKKTNSSHGFGAGDGNANQAWVPDNGNGNADAAMAGWNNIDKKRSGRGKRNDQADQWAADANKWDNNDNNANQWDNAADQWNNNGNHDDWPEKSNSKKSDRRKSDRSGDKQPSKTGWSNQGNHAAAGGWDIQGGGNNDNKDAGGWPTPAGSNKSGGWGNAAQSSSSKTASQSGWSNKEPQDARPARSTKDDVYSKAHIKPYFNDWNKAPAEEHNPAYKHRDTPRDAHKYPALPRPAVPSNEAKDKSHGVQAGKGADYTHKTRVPEYVDTMEQPYAVFTFKYRSKKVLEQILKTKIDEVDVKKIQEQVEMEKLLQQPKHRLAQELARMRMGQGRQRVPRSEKKPESEHWSKQSSSHRGGWRNDGQDAAPADDGWGGKARSQRSSGCWADGSGDPEEHEGGAEGGEQEVQAAGPAVSHITSLFF